MRLQLDSPRVVPRSRLRVHIDHLAISLVLEQQAGLVVGDDLEVLRGVRGGSLRLPVVKAVNPKGHILWLRQAAKE